jgi:hypothetical protein
MIVYYSNSTDITASVQFGSLSISEQSNNRRNTARFMVNNSYIAEATKITIYKISKLSANISVGVSSFVVDSVYTTDFYRVGDKILLGIKTANEEIVTVLSVNPTTRTITISGVTKYTHSKDDMV